MLIECKECKNQISDKAKCCPHCGYPIESMSLDNYCSINGIEYDLSDLIDILPTVGDKDTDTHPSYLAGIVCDKTSLEWDSAKKLVDIIIETKKVPSEFNGTIEIKPQINTPHCPICNSTNIKRISTTTKITNIAMFGLLGNKRKKTFHCNNCKYEW